MRYENGDLVEQSSGISANPVMLDDVIAQLGALTGTPEFESYGKQIEEITKSSARFTVTEFTPHCSRDKSRRFY